MSEQWIGKRYWVIGASEGLGEAIAQILSRSGVEVIVSARNGERLAEVVATLPGPAMSVPMDLQDDASVAAAAQTAGDVDGLILVAGVYWPFAATQWDAAAGVAMADTNFTGYMRVLGAVLPGMVQRDAGHVVITGSLAGFRGLPGAIGYGASKAAVMSLAESLYADLKRTGVRVQLANPGFIRTRLTDKNSFRMPYIMEPEDAARAVFELMNTERFQRSFPRLFSWVFRAGRLLPDWLYYRLFS